MRNGILVLACIFPAQFYVTINIVWEKIYSIYKRNIAAINQDHFKYKMNSFLVMGSIKLWQKF